MQAFSPMQLHWRETLDRRKNHCALDLSTFSAFKLPKLWREGQAAVAAVFNFPNFIEEQRHYCHKRSNCNAEAQKIFCDDHHIIILKTLLNVQDNLIKIASSARFSNIFWEQLKNRHWIKISVLEF